MAEHFGFFCFFFFSFRESHCPASKARAGSGREVRRERGQEKGFARLFNTISGDEYIFITRRFGPLVPGYQGLASLVEISFSLWSEPLSGCWLAVLCVCVLGCCVSVEGVLGPLDA